MIALNKRNILMKGFLFFLFFLGVTTFQGFSQERHLKNAKSNIEKGAYDKALEKIITYETSVGVKYESIYFRYLLQSKIAKNIVEVDSAIHLLQLAKTMFAEESDEKKKSTFCEELQICGTDFPIISQELDDRLYELCKKDDSIDNLNWFILNQYQSPHIGEAKLLRNKLAFNLTLTENTEAAYISFTKKYPDSDEFFIAKDSIESINYAVALKANSIISYQQFIDKFPRSKKIGFAKSKMWYLAYNEASYLNTKQAYRDFIRKYPSSDLVDKAQLAIELLDWDLAIKENSKEGYQLFANSYPKSDKRKIALEKIETFDWINAVKEDSSVGYEQFLRAHPLSDKKNEALNSIERLKVVVPYLTSNLKYKLYDPKSRSFVSDAEYDMIEPIDNEFFVVTNSEKKGILNKFGSEITLITYDCFWPVGKTHLIFTLGNKLGLLNRKGETVIQPIYDDLDAHGDTLLITYIKSGKYVLKGLIDLNGKVLIENKFRELNVIGPDQLIVSFDKKVYYLANAKGQLISIPLSSIDESLTVTSKGKQGLLNLQGKFVIPAIYNSLRHEEPGYFIAENNEKKVGVIDSLGKIVIPFDKYSVEYVGQGIYSLNKAINQNIGQSSYYLFDSRNAKTINAVPYEEVGKFSEGLIWVKIAGKVGFVNSSGKLVISNTFDSTDRLSIPEDSDFKNYVDIYVNGDPGDGPGPHGEDFGEDYIDVFCYNNKHYNKSSWEQNYYNLNNYEYCHNLGPILPNSLSDFSDGLAVVSIGEKVGAIDKNGKIIVPIIYDYLTPFRNGIAVGVSKKSDQQFVSKLISSTGQTILEGFVIVDWLNNDRLILKNRAGELYDYSLSNKKIRTLDKNFEDIIKFKEYLTIRYKDVKIYTSLDFLTWYVDKNIDFSAYDAQQLVESGDSHRYAKEYNEALNDYQKALRKSPNNFNALIGIAENYKDQNSTYNAIEYINKAMLNASNYDKYRALSLKFEIYKGQSNWSEAINAASEIIYLNSTEVSKSQWYLERGFCRYESRSFSEAIDDITTSFQGESPVNSTYAYNLRGNSYYELKMYSYAVADYKKAISLGATLNESNENLGIFHTNLGNTYLKLNKLTDAQLAFKRAAGLGNQNAVRALRYNNFK